MTSQLAPTFIFAHIDELSSSSKGILWPCQRQRASPCWHLLDTGGMSSLNTVSPASRYTQSLTVRADHTIECRARIVGRGAGGQGGREVGNTAWETLDT